MTVVPCGSCQSDGAWSRGRSGSASVGCGLICGVLLYLFGIGLRLRLASWSRSPTGERRLLVGCGAVTANALNSETVVVLGPTEIDASFVALVTSTACGYGCICRRIHLSDWYTDVLPPRVARPQTVLMPRGARRASLIYRPAKNHREVQSLFEHAKLESTVRCSAVGRTMLRRPRLS